MRSLLLVPFVLASLAWARPPLTEAEAAHRARLSPRTLNVLKRLGDPNAQELSERFTLKTLEKTVAGVGVVTLKELLAYTTAAGHPLAGELHQRDPYRSLQHRLTRLSTVLEKLGHPTPEQIAARYTIKQLSDKPMIGRAVLIDLVEYVGHAGFTIPEDAPADETACPQRLTNAKPQ